MITDCTDKQYFYAGNIDQSQANTENDHGGDF